MKKLFVIVLAVIMPCICVFAQDAELNRLADIVFSLQSGGEKAYNNAVIQLAADKLWTPMDELTIDRAVECKASERVPGFRLNAVLTNAENENRYQTSTGNHLNGADSRYNYSLFEKTLRAGKTTTFTLPGRWGEQEIIIIPYQGLLDASAKCGDAPLKLSKMSNGCLKLSGRASKDSPLTLTITNQSESSISYVIINYNSRR